MEKFFLSKLRTQTDPLADELINSLIQSNQLETVNKMLFLLNKNFLLPESTPPELSSFLTETSRLPTWADEKKIKKAQELYAIYGLEISLILFCKSLPQSYCCPKGVKVLHASGRLNADNTFNKFTRRVMETSQFVMNALSSDSMNKEGSGIITTQKVRLLHASIRYYLRKYNWNTAEDGEPINQEDMLGTLMSFSALVVEGLEMMGINWTEEEKDAYIHTWNVVGYILGVNPEILPENYKEAIAAGYCIFDDQKGYSKEGQELTEALISFIHYILPGNILDGMAENMIYFFLGENAKYVGLNRDQNILDQRFAYICKLLGGITGELKENSAIIRAISIPFSRMILNGIILSYNDFKGPCIVIPPSLQENWKLNTAWVNTFSGPEIFGRRLAVQKKTNQLK